jgi:HAMP domain-containing protein
MDATLAVSIAACLVAALALLVTLILTRRLGRLQESQKAVLGGASHDMVDFAVSLQGRIDDLGRAVDEVAAGLSRVDRRIDGAITNTAVVRYDAYEDTGGKQSASFAFLDATRTGTVVTAIQGRDYARIYVKDVERGIASVALSPEELTAVERAMAR